MLDANLKTQMKGYLEPHHQPVELVASLDDSAKSRELQELLQEIASLSDKRHVRAARRRRTRKPSFAINRAGTDIGVRFAGLPMGHEFTSLVLALLQVGGHPSKESAGDDRAHPGADGDYTFETYFSLSCQNCPDVVQALNLMSVLNPRIRHVAIDGALFQDEVEKRGVMAVPAIFLNGQPFGQGRMSLEQILAKLDTGAERAPPRRSPRRSPSTCWWSAAARPVRRRRSTPRARASAPASPPSGSAARCWTRWASRTSSRSRTPRARSWSAELERTSATTRST
jgi:alkyl hydroperoxide reductase subunit F